jgi:hypothetical protein
MSYKSGSFDGRDPLYDGRDPLHPGFARARDHSYSPKIRDAMMFFWICDVPPITLCARL